MRIFRLTASAKAPASLAGALRAKAEAGNHTENARLKPEATHKFVASGFSRKILI